MRLRGSTVLIVVIASAIFWSRVENIQNALKEISTPQFRNISWKVTSLPTLNNVTLWGLNISGVLSSALAADSPTGARGAGQAAARNFTSTTLRSVQNRSANVSSSLPIDRAGAARIPEVLHFVHVTRNLREPCVVPEVVLGRIKAWQSMNPTFTVFLWDNTRVRNYFPHLISMLVNISVPAWASDVLRYVVLAEHGGLYLDTDFEPIHPVGPLLEAMGNGFAVCGVNNRDLCAGNSRAWEGIFAKSCFRGTVVNGVIASVPGGEAVSLAAHHAIRDSLKILKGSQEKSWIAATGPPMWGSIVRKTRIRLLCARTFLQCRFSQRLTAKCNSSLYTNFPYSYANHLWAASWHSA
mmetsp:Transcript_13524/g.34030  ORF Transcript_13524/g.34030 Transcript_13524/m.34030 type:complete len:353 (+) Transcript_13524:274-1332(+)